MEKITVEELLFTEEPIVVNRKLAKCLGLKEAVIFQQIHYWLKTNKKSERNFINGKYWTYNPIKKWHEKEFDFLSLRTVERTIAKLENDGLLESDTFNKMKGDKTKWYTINYDKLIEVCEKKLSEKEILSMKRSASGKLGAQAKASKQAEGEGNTPMQPTWQNGAYNQLGNTIPPTWQNDSTNLAEPIPEISTKTSTKITTSNLSNTSSKGEKSPLVKFFEENICELRKTTLPKFEAYAKKYDSEFIKEIIKYGALTNGHSYNWFASVIEKYIAKDMTTADDVKLDIEKWQEDGKQSKNRALKQKEEKRKASEEAHKREMAGYDALNNMDLPEIEYDTSNGELVNELKESFRGIMSEVSFNTWINTSDFIKLDGKIIVECPNAFTVEIIEKKYYETMVATLREIGVKDRLILTVKK